MKKARLLSWATLLSVGLVTAPVFAQAQDAQAPETPTTDLMKFLSDKEKQHVEGKLPIEQLNQEEREHVQRILRLQNLRREEDLTIVEPAGADVPQEVVSAAAVDNEILNEAEELRRENARLRSEVRRLHERISDIQYQADEIRDEEYNRDYDPFQRRPRFYMPVR